MLRLFLLLSFFYLGVQSLSSQLVMMPKPDGELDHRIRLSVDRLLDPNRRPAFTPDFILADVDLKPEDPRRFYNFSGDLSGRYIEVISLLSENQRSAAGLPDLVAKLLTHQQADGRFGDETLNFTAEEINGEHMALLWGNGRLLVGLMTYYEVTGDTPTLAAARRLGDFFLTTARSSRQPEVVERLEGFGAKGIICFTQYIEGLVMLARATGEKSYRNAAAEAYTVLPPRGKQHTHGYLSTLRGVLMLHELTGEQVPLDYAMETFDDLLESDDHTLYGAVNEYFGEGHKPNGRGGFIQRDEGCSSADFLRVALHLYQLTGKEKYRVAGERALVNALYLNQYLNGDFGNHYYDGGVIKAAHPMRAWWCCTMHGLRALLAVKNDLQFRTLARKVDLSLLLPQEYADKDIAFKLLASRREAERTVYPLVIKRWPASKLLGITPPKWATDWQIITGEKTTDVSDSGLHPVVGDTIFVSAKVPLLLHAEGNVYAPKDYPEKPVNGHLTHGPYLLGIVQTDFVAEPDWYNQVLLSGLNVGVPGGRTTSNYHPSGYPGLYPVELMPVGDRMYYDHTVMRVGTWFGKNSVPRSPDR